MPLGLPDPAGRRSAEEIARFPAVRLFVERAGAIARNFMLTEENARAVAEICVRLDGIPLAIELAAARVNLLQPQDLVERLPQRLNLLTAGPRDAPARHQTLRDAIAWSYNLLTPREQVLFRRLSVFAGSGGEEAVRRVHDADGDRYGQQGQLQRSGPNSKGDYILQSHPFRFTRKDIQYNADCQWRAFHGRDGNRCRYYWCSYIRCKCNAAIQHVNRKNCLFRRMDNYI
jgi:hypothetical protein